MDVKINDLVTYESVDHIATITINRADRMNALNEDVILAFSKLGNIWNKAMTAWRFCVLPATEPFP